MGQGKDDFNRFALVDEMQARRLCERLCADNPDLPRLRNIASVGSYDGVVGGPGVDSRRLTGVMSYLLQSGFMIDPDFNIDVINFRQKRDFLIEETKADLVFVSFILARRVRGTLVYGQTMNEHAEKAHDYRMVYGLALSDQHDLTKWKNRIEGSGAKIVATYGGQDEIGTHNLRDEPHTPQRLQTLIKTPQYSMGHYASVVEGDKNVGGFELETKSNLSFLYNNAANDLPMPWLGFTARPDYLRRAAPGLSGETALGRAARHFSGPAY